MHILFDKNVPFGLRRFLNPHKNETLDDRGWARLRNGDLIKSAESSGFDLVITADQNIVYQQNLEGRRIALLVLGSNIWPIVRTHAAQIASEVNASKSGTYAFLEMPIPRKSK